MPILASVTINTKIIKLINCLRKINPMLVERRNNFTLKNSKRIIIIITWYQILDREIT